VIVMKFGGTSVENAEAIRRLTEIVRKELGRKPIVLVSACSGVTNQLLKIGALASEGQPHEALELVTAIAVRHKKIIADLFDADDVQLLSNTVALFADELGALVNGVTVLGELTPRSLDTFTSYGERLSSFIIHHYFRKSQLHSVLVDARTFMITDGAFTKAIPQFDVIEERLRDQVVPLLEKGNIVMTQGFIGSTSRGITTTIGRGGSDYSAAIIGALINAEEIQIWTDVDGILSSDPSVVPNAKKIRVMSFDEAAELAYFGARVLHPETIRPAVEKNVPVRVLNSRRPEYGGTLIVARPVTRKQCVVKSIAYKEGITLISIVSTRMFMAHGFLENVFDVFHKYQTVVHTVATSEVSVSATIDNISSLEKIVEDLQAFSNVTVRGAKAIVCVVGDNLRSSAGMAARILNAIPTININMISQGASEINLSFVVDEEKVDEVVQKLHSELFADADALTEIFEP
jgi:aspartate kinase